MSNETEPKVAYTPTASLAPGEGLGLPPDATDAQVRELAKLRALFMKRAVEVADPKPTDEYAVAFWKDGTSTRVKPEIGAVWQRRLDSRAPEDVRSVQMHGIIGVAWVSDKVREFNLSLYQEQREAARAEIAELAEADDARKRGNRSRARA